MTRVAMLVGALTLIGGVLGGCGQEPATGASPETAAAPPSGAEPGSSAVQSPSSPPTAPAGPSTRTIGITVRGGQATGETGRAEVPLGTAVTLSVTSDVADEIHVHGYEQEAQVPAGGTGSVSFTADLPGVFEVELHDSGLQLLQLQVS